MATLKRPPQGRPLIIQAGASEAGKELAAETADVVYGIGATISSAKAYYDDLKGRMARYGRDRDELKILSGFTIVMGETEDEARSTWNSWQDLVHPDVGLVSIKLDLEVDLFDLPLNEPIPRDRVPASANFTQSYHKELSDMVDEGLTLREMIRRYNRNKAVIFGSPSQVVNQMEAWVGSGASDGFILNFPTIPSSMAVFVEKATPELQRRGLFHQDYQGATLRDQLGLKRPVSRYKLAS